jgi:2,3-bisphosphoglycerate-dependent phosphoglycerate mutase
MLSTNKKGKNYLYVITHCESCYNKSNIFTGKINSKLSEDGHIHAQILAEELRNKTIDIAYTSSLVRTKQTLKHILEYHPKTRVYVDDRLIEKDYGEISRKNKAKFKRDYPELFPIYHRSYDIAPPGGESMKEVEVRVLSFLKELIARIDKNNINVLIVTHGNTIRPIRKYFENLSNDKMLKLEHNRHKVFTYVI